MPREVNYKIGVDTKEARTQLMQMQSQITNTVNKSHQAVNQVTPTDSTSLEHARRQQASMNLPSPFGEPFGVGNKGERAKLEKLQGGYNYKPSIVGAGAAVMGMGSAPTGVPDYKWQEKNQEIFRQRTGDLGERAGIMAVGGIAGTAGYMSTEFGPGRKAAQKLGQGIGQAMRGAGKVAGRTIAPLQKLPGGGAVKALRSIGAKAGKALPGIGKFIGPAITSGAASVAAFSSITSGISDIGTKRGFEQQLDHISPSFITSDVKPGISSGFDMGQRNEIADFMTDLQNDTSMSAGGLSSLMKGGAQIGRFNGVETAQDFKKEFSKLVNEVKEVTSNLRMTLDEGLSTIDNLRSMGVDTAGQMNNVTNKMRARAGISGQTTRDMMNTFRRGANKFSKMGLDPAAGGNMLSNINANVMNKVKRGEISPVELRQKGGVQGMTSSIANDLTRSMTQGSIGNLLVSALGNEDFTGVDAGSVEKLLRSGGNPTVARAMANENLSSQDARSKFKANRKQVQSDLLSSPLSPYFVGAMTKKSLNKAGVDPTRPNMEIALRNQGVKNTDQFLDVATDPEFARNVINQRKRVAYTDTVERLNSESLSMNSGVGGALSTMYDYSVQPAVDATSYVGEGLRDLGEDFTGLFGSKGAGKRYREMRTPDFTPSNIKRNADEIKAYLEGENVRGQPEPPGVASGSPSAAGHIAQNDFLGSLEATTMGAVESVTSSLLPTNQSSMYDTGEDQARRHAWRQYAESDHPYFRKVAEAQLNGGNVKEARESMFKGDDSLEKEIFSAADRDVEEGKELTIGNRGDDNLGDVVENKLSNFAEEDGNIGTNTFTEITKEVSQEFFNKDPRDLDKEEFTVLSNEVMGGIEDMDGNYNIGEALQSAEALATGDPNSSKNQLLRSGLEASSKAQENLEEIEGISSDQAEQLQKIIGGNPKALEGFKSTMERIKRKDISPGRDELVRRLASSTEVVSEEDASKMYDMIRNIESSDDVTIQDTLEDFNNNQELKSQLKKAGGSAMIQEFARQGDQLVKEHFGNNKKINSIQDLLSSNEKGMSDLVSKMDIDPNKKIRKSLKKTGLTGDTLKFASQVATESDSQKRTGGIPNASTGSAKQMEKVLDQVAELDKLASSIEKLSISIGDMNSAGPVR